MQQWMFRLRLQCEIRQVLEEGGESEVDWRSP